MGEKTMRVLILDDERTFRESLAGALRAEGFQVDTAATGQEAIDKVRENRGDYDLLIIDQVLREPPDGIEVMARSTLISRPLFSPPGVIGNPAYGQ